MFSNCSPVLPVPLNGIFSSSYSSLGNTSHVLITLSFPPTCPFKIWLCYLLEVESISPSLNFSRLCNLLWWREHGRSTLCDFWANTLRGLTSSIFTFFETYHHIETWADWLHDQRLCTENKRSLREENWGAQQTARRKASDVWGRASWFFDLCQAIQLTPRAAKTGGSFLAMDEFLTHKCVCNKNIFFSVVLNN